MKKINLFKKSLFVAFIISLLTVLPESGKTEIVSTLDASPTRIAMKDDGNLLVTDYIFGQVLTVSPDSLEIIDEINVNGRPLGIAWANELVYVGNNTTGQVEVYNVNGQKLFILGYGNYPIETPQDIATGNGNVYVVDGSEKIVKVFNQDGTFVGTIPDSGYDRTKLANPTAITVDEINQQVFVSDYGDLGSINTINPRVQVFGFDGTLRYTITSGEINRYRFSTPQGLTLSGNNELYMIDSLTGEIHIFDANNGNLLSKVKGSGIDKGEFMMKMPLDLVINNTTNDVFVTNNMLASIKVFAGSGGI